MFDRLYSKRDFKLAKKENIMADEKVKKIGHPKEKYQVDKSKKKEDKKPEKE